MLLAAQEATTEVIALLLQSPCIGQVRARGMKAWNERVRAVLSMMECL